MSGLKRLAALAALSTTLMLALPAQAAERWYDQKQVTWGADLFAQNCASCHGAKGEGTKNWKTPDAKGVYPPPPINGTGHAWHHDLALLRGTVKNGGKPVGGVMPAFGEKLSDEEVDAVLAYVQSQWPDQIYNTWASRGEPKAEAPSQPQSLASSLQAGNRKVTRLLEQRLGQPVPPAVETPVDGIYQTRLGANVGYLTEDGRYIFMGQLIDLKTGANLTENAKREAVRQRLGEIDDSDKVIYPAAGEEKAVLTIFTDTTCPYCRKLHKEVPQLNQAGITIKYLPFPRGGASGPGYTSLKQVWCARDRQTAMSIAKENMEGELPGPDCAAAAMVDRGYQLGNEVGVTGTPALFKSNGQKIEGYVPYQTLIPMVLGNS